MSEIGQTQFDENAECNLLYLTQTYLWTLYPFEAVISWTTLLETTTVQLVVKKHRIESYAVMALKIILA